MSHPRIDREDMFLQMARLVAQRGTCSRAQVGAVLVRDNRVISIGYNGAPPGMPHCDHTRDSREIGYRPSGCEIAVHAETNAIMYAARSGTSTDGAEMYCTHAPCLRCAQLIITSGVKIVYYEIPYRLRDGVELLDKVFVPCVHWICAGEQRYREAEEIDPLNLEVHDYVMPPRPADQPAPDWANCQICGRHAQDEVHLTGEGPHVPMIHQR